MPLPYPPLGALRVASPREILRIGIVAAAGFRYSPVFDWERPYHEKFPTDTLLSYRREFVSCLKSPEHIVLVALDKFDPEEGSKSRIIIPENNGWEVPNAGDEVVVGVACWKLQPGSSRIGDFQNDTGWGLELAKIDQTAQGVIAATMGKVLFTKLGFENKGDLKLDGDEIVPAGVMVSAMLFSKGKGPSAEL
ncbi:hypothetical protein K4K59_008605 [Colletotrichum sp. SAR11_240]|nr:hypothetical protein K4K59_008605 [Colletotrichum sp. SAR11_240]